MTWLKQDGVVIVIDTVRNYEIFMMRVRQSSLDEIAKKFGLTINQVSLVLKKMTSYVEKTIFRASASIDPFEQEEILLEEIRMMRRLQKENDLLRKKIIQQDMKINSLKQSLKNKILTTGEDVNLMLLKHQREIKLLVREHKQEIQKLQGKLKRGQRPEIKKYKQEAEEWKRKYHLLLTQGRSFSSVSARSEVTRGY